MQLSRLAGFKQVLFTVNDGVGYHEAALRQMYETLLEKFDDPTDAQREATEWAYKDNVNFNKAAQDHRQAALN